ncbi:hypothetical protein LMG19083_04728 [Ralstonia psammae]|uniref:Uncharacterized protein n=1 Tax=Ralstonia psammae TaxID=3058598 RepID=A0ABM9JZQ5_9RALS|nr:hypothetical protein LMG19083_04728 [Ralstonia sp. LMG 19083]
MVRRRPEHPPPLAAGTYRAVCREVDVLRAAMNEHGSFFSEAICVSDGRWCTFYCEGTEVWSCNASYAAVHFDMEPKAGGNNA